jgi:hypothetical protein
MTASVTLDDAASCIQISRDIAEAKDLAGSRTRIVELAVATMGFGGAAIWSWNARGGLVLDTGTDPDQEHTFLAVSRSAPGLGLACFEAKTTMAVDDFGAERRWPVYVDQLLLTTSIRSGVAYYLGTENHPLGVLALYANEPHAFTPEHIKKGATFAELATLALKAAADASKVFNLELALASNRRIGIAIGVLMALHQVTDEQAFELIRKESQAHHVKLRDVAEVVATTGAFQTR